MQAYLDDLAATRAVDDRHPAGDVAWRHVDGFLTIVDRLRT
ncbi:hypothetical protein [Lichenifustis flavocetrariae]|nr:hypothetical protein [Lichenifustis flavocetrariae]